MPSKRIKALRAGLISRGYSSVGGYKDYRDSETLYIPAKICSQKRALAIARQLGFDDVFASGEHSIALPVQRTKQAKKKLSEYSKSHRTPERVLFTKDGKHPGYLVKPSAIKGLIAGITLVHRIEIAELIIMQLPIRKRKSVIQQLVERTGIGGILSVKEYQLLTQLLRKRSKGYRRK